MELPPISELKLRYVDQARPLPVSVRDALRDDGRQSALAILRAVEKRQTENRREAQRLRHLCRYETPLWEQGLTLVGGIDEAGMSPLAGPVSAACVILPPNTRIDGVDDSKKLSAAQRDELAPIIKRTAVAWAVAFVEPTEIDDVNIYWAGILAMKRALESLGVTPQHLLIDARKLKDVNIPQSNIIRGDQKSITIASASILAKTARDARMTKLDEEYPGYGFAKHKGYGVAEHQRALRKLGPCPMHRRSFAPVRAAEKRKK